MTKEEAIDWVRRHDDDDDCDNDDLEAAFRALYDRKPDAQDREEGLWSHVCVAALKTTKTKYAVEMRDDSGASESVAFKAEDDDEAAERAASETEEWLEGGDWGRDGANVTGYWSLKDEDGDEIQEGRVSIDIEPDHEYLIERAGGDPDCDHDWSSEGEGGLKENPGVWSTGGTSMTSATHCRLCGLHRIERTTGSQRNPGEHDTVEYRQPDRWCAECERADCTCKNTFTIRDHETGAIQTLRRDVCWPHPQWVHDQLGTESETELQQMLDQLCYNDYEGDDRDDLGVGSTCEKL